MKPATKKALVVIAGNLVNPVLGVMWAIFAVSTWMTWSRTHSVVALLLFCVNTLFAVLFVTRRHSKAISNDPKDWMITAATILLSFSLRVAQPAGEFARVASQGIQGAAVLLILISLVALGRSFGLIPANRGVKTHSLYSWVRHPLYSGEILFYFGFVLGNLSLLNAVIFTCIILGLSVRASSEERLLKKDQTYADYLKRVRFRFFPGIY
ncbi:MAG: DUF1295 domain-containing protein [Planctomycetes bacterium]|nr:DUF1295 domain-containing protein [Planctomycetota bacterium]